MRTGRGRRARPPITDTDTILPPPSGIPIRARPASSRSMLAFAETNTIENVPASAASATAASTHRERPDERRIGGGGGDVGGIAGDDDVGGIGGAGGIGGGDAAAGDRIVGS